jgi:hypothetical protein
MVAIAGGLAGLKFGVDGIREDWIQQMIGKTIIDQFLADLVQ